MQEYRRDRMLDCSTTRETRFTRVRREARTGSRAAVRRKSLWTGSLAIVDGRLVVPGSMGRLSFDPLDAANWERSR